MFQIFSSALAFASFFAEGPASLQDDYGSSSFGTMGDCPYWPAGATLILHRQYNHYSHSQRKPFKISEALKPQDLICSRDPMDGAIF